jgi:hypothetical protein
MAIKNGYAVCFRREITRILPQRTNRLRSQRKDRISYTFLCARHLVFLINTKVKITFYVFVIYTTASWSAPSFSISVGIKSSLLMPNVKATKLET